ncbi:MAG: hypothetical protein WCY19_07110 [Candidatus Gastranaerophilaceae bacterium]
MRVNFNKNDVHTQHTSFKAKTDIAKRFAALGVNEIAGLEGDVAGVYQKFLKDEDAIRKIGDDFTHISVFPALGGYGARHIITNVTYDRGLQETVEKKQGFFKALLGKTHKPIQKDVPPVEIERYHDCNGDVDVKVEDLYTKILRIIVKDVEDARVTRELQEQLVAKHNEELSKKNTVLNNMI